MYKVVEEIIPMQVITVCADKIKSIFHPHVSVKGPSWSAEQL